jgi:hypothetical protein
MMSTKGHLDHLLGVWDLQSFILCTEDDLQPIAQPLGEAPLGRIMFLPSGYMSCTLTNPDVTQPIESGIWSVAPDDEVANVARSMTTYCGYFRLFEGDGCLRLATEVDIALDPSWIKSTQTRKVTFQQKQGKDFMTLTPIQSFNLPVCHLLCIRNSLANMSQNGMKTVGVLKWSRLLPNKLQSNL